MSFDPIRAIEACYAPVAEEEAWLAGIAGALAPLEQGMGGAALTYDARDPGAFRMGRVVTTAPEANLRSTLEVVHRSAQGAQVEALYWRPPPCGSLLETIRSVDPAARDLARAFLESSGYPDIFAVHGAEPDHRGTLAGFASRRGWRPTPRLAHDLSRLAAHLSTAFRLRNALGAVPAPEAGLTEAVLEPSGRVADARGAAREAEVRSRLCEALRRVERARGRARRTSPGEAVELWRGLVDGTWSLVDHVESGGRRYVLAVRNPPGIRDPRELSERERDVVALALLGRSNKWIGYTLGLAPSTVAEHLARAERKLGARSRTDLILAFGGRG